MEFQKKLFVNIIMLKILTNSVVYQIGTEDKIISTKGYCCVVTDGGTGFFDDLKKKESQK